MYYILLGTIAAGAIVAVVAWWGALALMVMFG